MITQQTGDTAQQTSLRLEKQCDLSSLRQLTHPSQLKELTLYDCSLSDLSPLVELQGLTTLHLTYCWQMRDLFPLAGLPHLATLSLALCPRVSGLGPLAKCSQLEVWKGC